VTDSAALPEGKPPSAAAVQPSTNGDGKMSAAEPKDSKVEVSPVDRLAEAKKGRKTIAEEQAQELKKKAAENAPAVKRKVSKEALPGSLAERRKGFGLQIQAKEDKPKREVVNLVMPDTIDNYYAFDDPTSGKLTHATSKTKNSEAGEPMRYMARIVPKDMFGAIDDPNVPVAHLSEFDWRKTIMNIHSNPKEGNLLSFTELLEDDKAYYLIMDECANADFVKELMYEKELTEYDVKRFIRQLLLGLDMLHAKGFVHRNVVPANIRFRGTCYEKCDLVLLPTEDVTHDDPGSPRHKVQSDSGEYVSIFHAPERLEGEFSTASDLWSVGVFLHILITGEPPYKSTHYESMKTHAIEWGEAWEDFPEAKELCESLLQPDAGVRCQEAAVALKCAWLSAEDKMPEDEVKEAQL
jgi:serine/threonine protein kinase